MTALVWQALRRLNIEPAGPRPLRAPPSVAVFRRTGRGRVSESVMSSLEILNADRTATTLKNCPVGLFWTEDGELGVKTAAYGSRDEVEAYFVSSGVRYWGAARTANEQRALSVRPVPARRLEWLARPTPPRQVTVERAALVLAAIVALAATFYAKSLQTELDRARSRPVAERTEEVMPAGGPSPVVAEAARTSR